MRTCVASAIFAIAGSLSASADTVDYDEPLSLGWLEHVRIVGADIKLDAKLDTGAKTASIDAEIISSPEQDDFEDEDKDRTIVFKVANEDGDERTIEAEIVRWVGIKTKDDDVTYRPVIEMEFCLGGRIIKDEVNLSDRSHFNYPTLIGRNMLERGRIIVDAGDIYTNKPRCSDD